MEDVTTEIINRMNKLGDILRHVTLDDFYISDNGTAMIEVDGIDSSVSIEIGRTTATYCISNKGKYRANSLDLDSTEQKEDILNAIVSTKYSTNNVNKLII